MYNVYLQQKQWKTLGIRLNIQPNMDTALFKVQRGFKC